MLNPTIIERKLNSLRNSFERVERIETPEAMQALYLDFWNDYLTAATFAEHIGVSESAARELIDAGRRWHDMRVDNFKWLKQQEVESND